MQYESGKIDLHGIALSHAGRSKGGAERMEPPPPQAAMGSRQTSENELKVRYRRRGIAEVAPNQIDKAV